MLLFLLILAKTRYCIPNGFPWAVCVKLFIASSLLKTSRVEFKDFLLPTTSQLYKLTSRGVCQVYQDILKELGNGDGLFHGPCIFH